MDESFIVTDLDIVCDLGAYLKIDTDMKDKEKHGYKN